MLFKKENNSLNERRGFPGASLPFRIMTYLNQIYIDIYTSGFHNFYIIEKRILSFIIYKIMTKIYR